MTGTYEQLRSWAAVASLRSWATLQCASLPRFWTAAACRSLARALAAVGCLCLLGAWLATPTAAQEQEPAPALPVGVIGEPAGTGTWPAVAESVASLRAHTVYHPAEMPDEKLPLVIWGNGACRDNGLGYAPFLREIASHGFFIVSLGHARFERGIEAPRAPAPAQSAASEPRADNASPRPADPTQAEQMLEAIDWAQQQTASGAFRNRIDTERLAVMGHSCGGLQAIRASADPRVSTSMIFNSGVLNGGPSSGRSGIQVTKDELSRLHGPVIYITGGPTDIAHPNALDDVARIEDVPLFFAYNDVGHGGTFWAAPNGGSYAEVAVAWLSWQLKGDHEAGKAFLGDECTLCADPEWTVDKKRID